MIIISFTLKIFAFFLNHLLFLQVLDSKRNLNCLKIDHFSFDYFFLMLLLVVLFLFFCLFLEFRLFDILYIWNLELIRYHLFIHLHIMCGPNYYNYRNLSIVCRHLYNHYIFVGNIYNRILYHILPYNFYTESYETKTSEHALIENGYTFYCSKLLSLKSFLQIKIISSSNLIISFLILINCLLLLIFLLRSMKNIIKMNIKNN